MPVSATPGKEPEPKGKWWEDEAEVEAFAKTHRGKLIETLGLSDLFQAPAPAKTTPAKGGGQEVKPLEAEGSMSALVTALTEGMKMGAAVGSSKAPSAAAAKRTKHHWFFGDYEEEE